MSSSLHSIRLSVSRFRPLGPGRLHPVRLLNARYNSSVVQDPMTGELSKLPDIEVC